MRVTLKRRSPRRLLLWGTLAAGLLALAGGIAYASVPDSQGVIHACRNNQSGIVKISESGECTPGETALDWVQSAGYEAYRVTPVTIATASGLPGTHVLTLSLPAGSYQVSSTIQATKANGDGVLACFAIAPYTGTPPFNATTFHVASMGTGAGDVKQVSMSGTGLVSLGSAGTVELRCRQFDDPAPSGADPQVKLADITAVRIGTVTQSAGS